MAGQIIKERCVVMLGKSGAGKSTVANQLFGYDPRSSNTTTPPFKVSSEVLQSVTREVNHVKFRLQQDMEIYEITVIDTIGLFDTGLEGQDIIFDKIEEYFDKYIRGVNIILFVFKQGRMTAEEKEVFTFLDTRLKKEMSPISALVVTGCENKNDKARSDLVDEFKRNRDTQKISAQMQMGVHPVGFPDLESMEELFQNAYRARMEKDRDTLRDLVFKADKLHLTKEMFLQKVKPAIQEACRSNARTTSSAGTSSNTGTSSSGGTSSSAETSSSGGSGSSGGSSSWCVIL